MMMKLFIPLICYNHTCHTSFMMSFMRLILFLKDNGIDVTVMPITFESLVSRARNAAVAHFLSNAACTHLLFIDSDIEFIPEDVVKLVRADKDVVCGAYAQKWLDFNVLKQGKPLEVSTRTSCHLAQSKVEDIMECSYATTGFLLIKRNVFEQMTVAYPDRKYVNDIDGYMGSGDYFYDFFPVSVNQTNRKYESEDYGFSRLWRGLGGKIYVVPDITLKHYGWFGFPANLKQQLNDLDLME